MSGIPAEKLDELKLNYAWDWFKHHADQRFAAFNFFLIVVGAVIVAYATAAGNHQTTLGVAVAGVGAVMAAGFFALDFRNYELVKLASEELKKLEVTGILDMKLTTASDPSRFLTHRFWLRLMLLAFLIALLAGAWWATTDYGHHATHAHVHHVSRRACERQYTSPCWARFSSSYGTPTRR
jgi:hypothetical protein